MKKRGIRGPRSALTDFIKENKIQTSRKSVKIENTDNESKIVAEIDSKIINETPKRKKTIKYDKPVEIVNRRSEKNGLKTKILKKIHENYENYKMNDNQLLLFSCYLSKIREVDQNIFDFLVNNFKEKLQIFDCSKIKKFEINKKSLKEIELRLCGQMNEIEINSIFKNKPKLVSIKITGAFLIENFKFPKKIKVLDVSNCSRLEDCFLNFNNELDYLNISFCYNFTSNIKLKKHCSEIIAEETLICDNFFDNIKKEKLKSLNINRCPNISDNFDLVQFKNLELLEVEGISTINLENISKKMKKLNINSCFGIDDLNFLKYLKDLEILNLSNLNLKINEIKKVLELKNLKEIDLSWIPTVNNEIIIEICEKLPFIEKIYVFGCFELTEEIGRYSWKICNKIDIIGNPSETKYLLNT